MKNEECLSLAESCIKKADKKASDLFVALFGRQPSNGCRIDCSDELFLFWLRNFYLLGARNMTQNIADYLAIDSHLNPLLS